MPIATNVDDPWNKAEFIVGRDVDLHFCSDQCLLKELDDLSRLVRTGQTLATALTVILDGDHLLVPLAGAKRAETHILGAQSGQESARVKWEKLLGHSHSALMPVYRVCNCMAEVQILNGEAFEDAATTPAWKKVRGIIDKLNIPRQKSRPFTFNQWRTYMAELAQGL